MEDSLVQQQQDQPQEQSQQERPSTSNALTAKETRRQNQRKYQADYRKRKREQEQLLAQQQYSIQQQQHHIKQQLQHSTQQQELAEHQAQQQHAGTAQLPMQPSTSNALTAKETRRQNQRKYQADYRKRKREQEQLLAQQQYPIQQQQHLIKQQLQHSTQQQELEEHQAQQQQHAGTAQLPMQPSTSNALTAEETRRQKQRKNQAAYRKRKREQEQLLGQKQHPIQQQQNPIQQQQHPIQQQLQHSTQQQELEGPQTQQQQNAGTSELPMQPSTSNASLTPEETRRQIHTINQEECRKRKREQEQLLAQQQNIEQQPQQQAQLLAQQQNIEQQPQQQAQKQQQQAKTASYTNFMEHIAAHRQFKLKFMDNHFGYACVVCDRLWFSRDLKSIPLVCRNLIHIEFPDLDFDNARVCGTCYLTLKTNKLPQLSKSNGFKYPPRPLHLPQLDILTERLVSPRLPFMQIRRLRHGQDQYGIFGQIINVPVSINNMVEVLPRNIDDDFAINVHIKKKLIHKSSYLMGLVKKNVIKVWLQYLIESPLYKFYNIKVNNAFFMDESFELHTIEREDLSEVINIEESLLAQQQTLLWNEDQYLCLASGQNNDPVSILFDENCEELSFPSIYLGEFRNFKAGLTVTPFMIATSELRRSDRRGVTPSHLLYMAMKIMRLRVRDSITIASKYIDSNLSIARNEVQNEHYLNGCFEKNLSFLRSIPNSIYYWSQRKRDLFAMIRQLGKPTLFLTMSANEIGWPQLMQILYKLKHNTELQETELQSMHFNDKATLVNEDPVTCAIHFNKIVNVIMSLLQSPRYSPFGKNYVKHFFKRIEFQHRGSPHALILLWLNEAPNDAMGANMSDAVKLIDKLVSVDASNCSGMQKLQTHKHTFTCNKNKNYSRSSGQNCRFGAPFMPSKATSILIPMPLTDARRSTLHKIYLRMWKALEENDYESMDTFLAAHNVQSEETYLDILRAGITRPMVILKRKTSEKWINPFNPFILYVLRSNMDMQFITEEYSCAAYVVEYVNKTNRGISNLQQNIIKLMDEHPEYGIVEITRHLGVNFLNSVELTSQESAWYLLRQPISQSSVQIIYIPTSWPTERERIRKTNADLDQDEIDGESCDIWKENVFDKYQKRPVNLENVSLAQFASRYTYHKGEFKLRQQPGIIRFRNYDVSNEQNNYKREMVTLHLAFRDEENDLLAEHKYLQLYDENYVLIMERRKEFEYSLDIAKTLEICRNMCLEYNDVNMQVEEDVNVLGVNVAENDGFADFLKDPNREINAGIRAGKMKKEKQKNAPTDAGKKVKELNPRPAYIEERNALWEKCKAEYEAEIAAKPRNPIKVTLPDGKEVDGTSWETTPYDVAKGISQGLADNTVISKVNGEVWDLDRVLESDCSLHLLKFDDPDAQAVFWHSSAHIMGEAMERIYGGHLCYGPPIADGFYYDMHLEGEGISTNDYPVMEGLVKQIVKEKQPFERLVMKKKDLLEMFKYNEFKCRILNEKVNTDTTTVYKCGPLIDLCRGPHVRHTGKVKALKITKNSSTYWEGKADAETLQRVYGISFPDAKQLKEWEKLQEEAAKRDHRKLGKEQELFFFHELSPGSCFFQPRGAHIYNTLMDFIKSEYRKRGFQEVITPNIYNSKLWMTSGHWQHYAENMFSFEAEKETFALKPMNCPGHCLMFDVRNRSWRELPLRMADFGVLHRNELSGALTGLTRVRRFQQDDAHIFCTPDQIKNEMKGCLDFLRHVYTIFGFSFNLVLSTRPEKYLGELNQWNDAEKALAESLDEFGLPWKENPGDGAFYGPKIDITIMDALKRAHQCATIQLDFQLPIRFNLNYIADDGEKKRPVIIHRAILGSVERMIAILTENYAGKWPFWISPRQVMVVPVGPQFDEYAQTVKDQLHAAGFMAEADCDDGDTMNKKIRNAQLAQCNFILVVGEKERSSNTVNVRTRDNKVHGEVSIADLITKLEKIRDEFITNEDNF